MEMEDEDRDGLVEIRIGTSLSNIEKAKEDANDLAWDHAKELASMTGLSLGSSEFEELFRQLSQRYENNTEYLKFLLMTAMHTVRDLLEEKQLALPHNGDRITETEVLELVTSAARTILTSYLWLSAGYEITWPTNEQMPRDVQVSFYFNPEDILKEEV
jgi:hypothetical protein